VRKLGFVFLLGTVALFLCVHASAQAARTWVSGVGDDANPCSRTAPCKTFAGTISKTAAGGEIDVLDPGGFGQVTITKAMTIDGSPNAGGVLASSGNGILIAAGLSDVVTLRNLNIVCYGTCLNGVLVNSAKAVRFQHVDIAGFTQHGVSTVSSTTIFMDDSNVRDSGQNGINIGPASATAYASIINSKFENNANGVVANGFAKVTARNTDAVGNTTAGFVSQAGSSASTLNLINCNAAFNSVAGVQANGPGAVQATVRMSGTSFTSNGVAMSTSGIASVLSFQNNPVSGAGLPTGTLALE
jgi:hypothetical protein